MCISFCMFEEADLSRKGMDGGCCLGSLMLLQSGPSDALNNIRLVMGGKMH